MSKRKNPDAVANAAARREARATGTEYRPTTAAKQEEAERLNRGFRMMDEVLHEDIDFDDD